MILALVMDKQIEKPPEAPSLTTVEMEAMIELEDTTEESTELATRTLVGKILTKKMLNKGAVRAICNTTWGEAADAKVSDMGPNVFMFTFPSKDIAQNVLLKSPWVVMNNILSLQQWNPEIAVTEIDFHKIPIWVQIHGLPLGAMTVANATKMMKLVGEIMEIEDPMVNGVLLRSFIRARINFNALNSIPTGVGCQGKMLLNPGLCSNMKSSWAFVMGVE